MNVADPVDFCSDPPMNPPLAINRICVNFLQQESFFSSENLAPEIIRVPEFWIQIRLDHDYKRACVLCMI
jgi:hypothetical protein